MTRERHIAIIQRIGKLDSATASSIVDRVLEEIELDQIDGTPVVIDFPSSKQKYPDVDKLKPPALSDNSSIVSVASGKDSTEPNGQFVLVNRLPPDSPSTEPLRPKFWGEVDLAMLLESATPNEIQVPSGGRQETITLARSIDPLLGLGIVKVSYFLRDAARSAPSVKALSSTTMADPVDRMAIESVASESFSCYEASPPVEEKMEKLRRSAAAIFGPRPEKIISTTPIRAGELSFRMENAPHDSV